jgi:hypothetical protein
VLREIYLRDNSDPKYNSGLLETNDDLEALLSKIRMLLYSNRGEVLGFPELGMDLENEIFELSLNEQVIRDRFYAQLAKFVPETQFKIDLEFERQQDQVETIVFMYITIDGQRNFGLVR